jgi:hypothetical protein
VSSPRFAVATLVIGGVCAAAASGASTWAGKPTSPPPSLGVGTKGPPPAWIESRTRSWWLAYSSYCWSTTCADYLPPQGRSDLPLVSVRRGSLLRLHLGFVPGRVTVSIQRGRNQVSRHLPPRRVTQFAPWRTGVLLIAVQVRGSGDASYVARIRLG